MGLYTHVLKQRLHQDVLHYSIRNFFLDGSCNVDHTAHVSVHGTTLEGFRVDDDVSIPVLLMQDAHFWRLTIFLEIPDL